MNVTQTDRVEDFERDRNRTGLAKSFMNDSEGDWGRLINAASVHQNDLKRIMS